jgi:hypothetical protein
MGKLGKKHGNTLQGGTVVQNGMRVWIDGRQMKGVTIRTGDKCKHLVRITFMISDASRTQSAPTGLSSRAPER